MLFSSKSNTEFGGRTNLFRLVVLRALAIALQLLTVLLAKFYLHQALPLVPIFSVIAIYALLTFYTWYHARQVENVDDNEYLLHLLADTTVLTSLLYFSGGASNPFIMLYLLPITIAIVLLPPRHVWLLAAITAGCYTLLVWQYVPLTPSHAGHDDFQMHVFGMWASFVIASILIAYFVVGMRSTLQKQQAALVAARERVMRDEQLVNLGTLAASTAHELGTPLATMSLLLDELSETASDAAERRQTIGMIKGQLKRCREALSGLSVSAGGVRLTGGSAVAFDKYMADLCRECEARRPGNRISLDTAAELPAPIIVADRSLSQALSNIIDNALKVSKEDVTIGVAWLDNTLSVVIEDSGEGVPTSIQPVIGKEPIAIGSDGLGLGLFLAHAVIQRFGGEVSLVGRAEGGSRTTVTLPLAGLTAG